MLNEERCWRDAQWQPQEHHEAALTQQSTNRGEDILHWGARQQKHRTVRARKAQDGLEGAKARKK